MATFAERKEQHVSDLLTRFGSMVEPLTWSSEQLATLRQTRLRELVAHATAHSPWYQDRFRGIVADTITEADIPSLPTMNKRDLMENFDSIVTDRRITRQVAEAHLSAVEEAPAYLFDDYMVVATGGSSGARTVLVWDWEGWMDCFLSLCRYQFSRDSGLTQNVIAGVAGDHMSHMSSAIQATFSNPMIDMRRLSASLPIEQIVAELNRIQPATLLGYASMIHRLVLEARAGRLRIAPAKVMSSSEALLPETRDLVREVWGVVVDNSYAASETGCIAHTCGRGPWLHLSDDTLIVEVEDDRVLVTNLVNRVMPLIRYELDDRVKLLDVQCPCGSAHRVIADVEGRSDDTFVFSGGRAVHPIVFSGTLGRNASVAEYQVRQRGDALDIDVVAVGDVDLVNLQFVVEQALEQAGAAGVKVTLATTDAIARHGVTGKLRRYLPG